MMNTDTAIGDPQPKAARVYNPKEFKLVALRDCATERENQLMDEPSKVADYWNQHVKTSPLFNPEVECFIVFFVNTRRRIKGHMVISTGSLDTILVHPREVFRPAIVQGSAAIILAHNHPSGDPTPSESDIKVTRELIRAGQLLKIEVLDHVVMGCATARANGYFSLRECGYFCI
jgi:DNA repair protein RadC